MEVQQIIYLMKAEEILDDKGEGAEPDKTQLGVDLKREISRMQLEITEEIKCLFKVVEASDITSEGLKEAREMRERLEDKLKRETKTMNEKIGEYLEKTEVKAEKDKIIKFKEENLPKVLAIKSKLMIISPAKSV